MLEKSKRLNLKKDFKWVATGRRIETKFTKIFIKMGENSLPRIGIATAKANFKKSSERNRARRLLSFALQSLYGKLPSNSNIITLPKAGILEVKSNEVLLDLETTLKNEKIIN